jgi:hypothetical protein
MTQAFGNPNRVRHSHYHSEHGTPAGGIMPWVILVLAGLFEVAWAIGLKYTDGFTRFVFPITRQAL